MKHECAPVVYSDETRMCTSSIHWNFRNPTPEFSDIMWHPTKMYGLKVFLLTTIKSEYSDILYNLTHFPGLLVCRIRQVLTSSTIRHISLIAWCVGLDRFHCICCCDGVIILYYATFYLQHSNINIDSHVFIWWSKRRGVFKWLDMPSNDSQWTTQLCSCFYIVLQFLWTYYTSSNDDDDNNNNASASYASTSNASASYASASDTNTKSYRINPGTNNNCCTARKGLWVKYDTIIWTTLFLIMLNVHM